MRGILPKILFYYSAIASFLITVSLVLTSNTMAPVIFAILFLPVTAYFIIEFFKQIRTKVVPEKVEDIKKNVPPPKKGDVIILTLTFFLLMFLGIRNIYLSQSSKNQFSDSLEAPNPSSSPFVFKVEPPATPAASLTISITDGSPSINIREKPTIYSEKVGTASEGETFTYMSKDSGWYQINLASGSGYVSAKYVKEVSK